MQRHQMTLHIRKCIHSLFSSQFWMFSNFCVMKVMWCFCAKFLHRRSQNWVPRCHSVSRKVGDCCMNDLHTHLTIKLPTVSWIHNESSLNSACVNCYWLLQMIKGTTQNIFKRLKALCVGMASFEGHEFKTKLPTLNKGVWGFQICGWLCLEGYRGWAILLRSSGSGLCIFWFMQRPNPPFWAAFQNFGHFR